MDVKTTLIMNRDVYKAAKRVAVERDTTVSAMVRKGLLIYISDPEGTDETLAVLTDKKAMQAIRAGEAARHHGSKDYYLNWDKVRDL